MDIILDDVFNKLNSEDQELYSRVARFAYELGYKCKRAKTKDSSTNQFYSTGTNGFRIYGIGSFNQCCQ